MGCVTVAIWVNASLLEAQQAISAPPPNHAEFPVAIARCGHKDGLRLVNLLRGDVELQFHFETVWPSCAHCLSCAHHEAG